MTTDSANKPEYKRAALIGRVFQDPFKGTCPSMSVAENLRMAELRGQRRGLRVGLSRSSLERYYEQLKGLGMRLEQGDRTIMVHRGEILADLSGSEREGLDANDLFEAVYRVRGIPLSLRLPKNRLPDWSASRFLRSYAFLTRIGRIWGGRGAEIFFVFV